MSIFSSPWEQQLLQKASVAFSDSLHHLTHTVEDEKLRAAYELSEAITKNHSKTFYLTSGLLKGEAKKAARALYAFCRISDDIVDNSEGNRSEQLAVWRKEALGTTTGFTSPAALAWADTRAKFRIPVQYAEQLLDGVAQDLTKNRYENFDELAHYCYGVASTVGLMTMHIMGFKSSNAIPYAIKLGVALQLTNILRDVGEDWQNGRLYLPRTELEAFGISEQDIDRGVVTENWRAFMRYQIARARRLYEEASPGIAMLSKQGRFAIAASADLYQAIMLDIEAHDYDVFNHRAYLTSKEKLQRLPGIWWQVQANQF